MDRSGKRLRINKPGNSGSIQYYAPQEHIWSSEIGNLTWEEENEAVKINKMMFQTLTLTEVSGSRAPSGTELEALVDEEENGNIRKLVPVTRKEELEEGLTKVREDL